MKVFYGNSKDRENVPGDSPTETSLVSALAVFRGLNPRSGFMGVVLNERIVLQMAHKKEGKVRIELLDTSIPAIDSSDVDPEFAESLIQAAAEGQDVFWIARASHYEWEHLDMR